MLKFLLINPTTKHPKVPMGDIRQSLKDLL